MKTIGLIALCGVLAVAQEQPRKTIFFQSGEAGPVEVRVNGPGLAGGDVMFNKEVIVASDKAKMAYVSAEVSVDGKPVKGAPYSADTVNENVQVLADGNRITHKSTGAVYRDSEGRTRREQTIEAIGPWSTSGEPVKTIIINDNVGGSTFFLDSKSKEAHKVAMIQTTGVRSEGGQMGFSTGGVPGGGAQIGLSMSTKDVAKLKGMLGPAQGEVKEESLGNQTMEGVVCQGTRITTTIPAGAMGNERPISMVTERWYSPELQVVVMSKHTDPRMGETTFRLERINRNEPAHSLFELPADFTTSTDTPKMRTFHFEPKE
jgi:hypothetical protein